MLTTFQPSDLDSFASVPAKWRKQADAWNRALDALEKQLTTKSELCKSMGCSLATLNRKITAVQEHGWRGLIPNYKGPVTLPKDFIDYWKTLQESYQRKTRPAYRELLRRWKDRYPIPGYAGHPGWPNLPAGWQERNLYHHQPSKLEITALRHGLGRAIAMHAPKTLGTRVGLWHLSHIIYDDVKLDVESRLLTSSKSITAQQIGALDLLSGDRFTYGMKPRYIRPDGSKTNVNEGDMRFAFANALYSFGISHRGSTIVIEHGTATLRGDVIDICKRYLGDKIEFSLSGMTGKMQAIAGMGDGKGGGGNFRHKAALESLHNLMHNELAALPGQTGHDRDEPEFLGVMRRENEQLWKLARGLPLKVLEDLRSPFMEYHTQFCPAVKAILDQVNLRDDHDLEGWLECGFIAKDYRLMPESAEWISEGRLLALPAPTRAAFLAMAREDKRCLNIRKMSPHEVFTRGEQSGEVLKVPQAMIAEILYQDLARPRKCQDGTFDFEDQEMAPGLLTYESRIVRPDGREMELTDRETYDTVVNPFDPSVMWVFESTRNKGAFLGLAKRDVRACRADAEAVKRKWGRSKERLSDLLSDTRRRNTGRTAEATARNTHNAKVITTARQRISDNTALATEAMDAALSQQPENDTDHEYENDTYTDLIGAGTDAVPFTDY